MKLIVKDYEGFGREVVRVEYFRASREQSYFLVVTAGNEQPKRRIIPILEVLSADVITGVVPKSTVASKLAGLWDSINNETVTMRINTRHSSFTIETNHKTSFQILTNIKGSGLGA